MSERRQHSHSRRGRHAESARAEKDLYRAKYLVRKAAVVDDPDLWKKLYDAIDTHGFFAHQAEVLGGFEQTTEDLERTLLPRVAEAGDWERFLHYAQTAAHLRGLAEALGEEPLVNELGRAGRSDLAESLVAQLSDPARRASLRAALAEPLSRSGEVFGHRLESVKKDLEEASGDGAEAWCGALEGVAWHLGPDLRACWSGWIESLPEGPLRDRVWRSVAESFLDRGDLEAPTLWRALAAIEDPDNLLDFLPERLARLAPRHPLSFVERLREELSHLEASVLWRLALPMASTEKAAGNEILRRLVSELGPPPWTMELVTAGRALWPRLEMDEIEQICRSIRDPVVAVALRVVALEGTVEPPEVAVRQALAAVEAMPAGCEQLHWALRLLGVRASGSTSELAGPVAILARHLARLRYAAAAEDLVRFLDLVAAVFPSDLRRQLESVLWAPESTAATLRTLAREATHPLLLEELFERAEECAALVADTPAEGFELRCGVLVSVSRQLCLSKGDLAPFETARERLLPEEEAGLRREVARGLAAVGRRDEAARVAAEISTGRRRLRTLLEVLPREAEPERQALLTPQALYQAVADSGVVRDELNALAPLLEEPRAPLELARIHLDEVQSPGRRIEGLVDLAHHALDWQEEHFSRALQDRLAAVLPLKQALGVVESDLWLARVTPELVDVGARLGPRQAVAEVQEAWERVIGAEAVPWETREEVLVALLGRLERLFPAGGGRKRLRVLVEWLARSPAAMADGPGRQELRRNWHRLVLWLSAVEARVLGGSERAWARRGLAPWRRRWDWLTPEQERVLELCFAPREERRRFVQALENGGEEEHQDLLWGLACRMTGDVPEAVPGLLARLTLPRRDRLGLLLLSGFWLPPKIGEKLLPLLSEEQYARSWGEVWSGFWASDSEREAQAVSALGRLVAEGVLEPRDPRTAALRRFLWKRGGEKVLARAAIEALARTGKEAADTGLCLFLNSWLMSTTGAGDKSPPRERSGDAWSSTMRASRLDASAQRSERLPRSEDGAGLPAGSPSVREIFRRCRMARRKAHKDEMPRTRWRLAFLLAACSAIVSFLWEASLTEREGTEAVEVGIPVIPVVVLLVGIAALSAWLHSRHLRASTPWRQRLRPLVTAVLTVWAALPILGLGGALIWRWLAARSPPWAVTRGTDSEALLRLDGSSLRRPPALRGTRWLGAGPNLGLLLAAQVGIVILVVFTGMHLSWRPGAVLLAVVLRSVGFASLLRALVSAGRQARLPRSGNLLVVSLAFLWLIPHLLAPLGTLFLFALLDLYYTPMRRAESGLVRGAWHDVHGRGFRESPAWSRLEIRLRAELARASWWRRFGSWVQDLERRREHPLDRDRFLWLCHLKMLFLPLEAAFAVGLLVRRAGLSPEGLEDLAGLTGALGLVAFFISLLARGGLRWTSRRKRLLPWVRPSQRLGSTQLLLALGLSLGTGLVTDNGDRLATWLSVAGLTGVAYVLFGSLFSNLLPDLGDTAEEDDRLLVLWLLFFVALAGFGDSLRPGGETAEEGLRVLRAAVMVAPLLGVLVSGVFLDWLIRPYRRRQLLERGTPPVLRRRLAFLELTALAPLGALAIPAWSYLRPRWWRDLGGPDLRASRPPPVGRPG